MNKNAFQYLHQNQDILEKLFYDEVVYADNRVGIFHLLISHICFYNQLEFYLVYHQIKILQVKRVGHIYLYSQ